MSRLPAPSDPAGPTPPVVHELPPDRPQVPSRPCPACGATVDPLRAPQVLVYEDGYRYLCSTSCRRAYLDGQRNRDETPSRESLRARATPRAMPRPRIPVTVVTPEELPTLPLVRAWLGLGAALIAAVLGLLSDSAPLVWAATAFSVTAAAIAAWISAPTRAVVGWFGWAMGPAGAGLIALSAAWTATDAERAWLALVGAALAGAVVVARAWIDAAAYLPTFRALSELRSALPAQVRIPVREALDASGLGFEPAPANKVRTGEEVIALAGDTVAVDGVIVGGEASALLYPGATTPMPRGVGDPLLAGARIIDGAVRILATRVGRNRALVRPQRFDRGSNPEAAPMARLVERSLVWGLPAVAIAAVMLGLGQERGLADPLAVIGSIWLACPVLALHRAVTAPIVAAAAAAGARGIVFRHAKTVDRAGRVVVVALAPHGTLTEGRPDVVEVHSVDGSSPRELVALAAAAEASVSQHPVADAILRYADAQHIELANVRRVTPLPGRGVTALGPNGDELVVGSRRLLLDEGISVALADTEAAKAEARGRTAVFVALGGRVRAVLSLQDVERPGARAAVQRMFDLGIEVVLLSGDQRGTVEALAKTLDIAHIKAELLPDERGTEVRRLGDTGGPVAAVGHPNSDDAALAAAEVPIALGAAGGAGGERGIALVTKDIRDAAAALWIARAGRSESLHSVRVALGVFALILGTSASGLMFPALAAVITLAVDTHTLHAGARLLRRIALRLPAKS